MDGKKKQIRRAVYKRNTRNYGQCRPNNNKRPWNSKWEQLTVRIRLWRVFPIKIHFISRFSQRSSRFPFLFQTLVNGKKTAKKCQNKGEGVTRRCSSRFLSFSKRSWTGGKLRKSDKISRRGRGWGDGWKRLQWDPEIFNTSLRSWRDSWVGERLRSWHISWVASGEAASEIPACHILYGFCLPPTFITFDESIK